MRRINEEKITVSGRDFIHRLATQAERQYAGAFLLFLMGQGAEPRSENYRLCAISEAAPIRAHLRSLAQSLQDENLTTVSFRRA